MAEENTSERERRKFLRLDLTEDVRALDASGQDIGRVERVGAGGMQVRLAENCPRYKAGEQMVLIVVEPGNVQQQFNVEVRVCEGGILGVQFLG